MELNQIKTTIATVKKGVYTNLTYKSSLKTNKENQGKEVYKVVETVVRLGIQYKNIQEVSERLALSVAQGGSGEPETLPWGKWVNGYHNYLIENKGSYYLRVNVSKGKLHRTKVTYYCNGEEISKEEAINLTLPSIWNENKEKPLVFTIKTENILSLGNH